MKERLFRLADWFLPAKELSPLALQHYRAAILQSWVGLSMTVPFSALYVVLGSPWSGVAISLITIGLVVSPWAIRAGATLGFIVNLVETATWLASVIVATRSGGLSSPAVLWSFIIPISTYSVCGARSAVFWSLLAALEVGALYAADLLGFPFAQDFTARTMSLLTVSGYLGLLIGIVAVLYVVENSRLASVEAMNRANRVLEREKLVHDMHDGIGSQLVGLTALARLGRLEPPQLLAGLEACLDDLHLIIDCRESQVRPLGVALAELRLRTAQRCEAADVRLDWQVCLSDEQWQPNVTLQVLRSAQEMLSNAIRHSGARHIRLRLEDDATDGWLQLSVADDGIGITEPTATRRGRGLNSMRARAQRLSGVFTIANQAPGTRVTLRFPQHHPSEDEAARASVGLRFERAQV